MFRLADGQPVTVRPAQSAFASQASSHGPRAEPHEPLPGENQQVTVLKCRLRRIS